MSLEKTPQSIYESRAMRVLLYPASDNSRNNLLCRFDYYDHKKTEFAPIRMTPEICARDTAVLKIETSCNNWFLTKDIDELGKILAEIAKDYAVCSSICFSMGITAALMLSRQLQLQRIMIFSPLVSIYDKDVPDRRFDHIKHVIECPEYCDRWKDGNHDLEGTLCFDPYTPMDVKQVRLIQKYYKNLQSVALPFMGHPCSLTIQNHFGFQSMQSQLIENNFSPSIIREMHRASRVHAKQYQKALQQRKNITL